MADDLADLGFEEELTDLGFQAEPPAEALPPQERGGPASRLWASYVRAAEATGLPGGRTARMIGGTGEATPELAATRGAVQGATFNAADEATGVLESTFPRLALPPGEFFDPAVPSPAARTYVEARNAQRALNEASKAAQPGAYLGGQVLGGAAASSVLPGGYVSAGVQGGLGGAGAAQEMRDIPADAAIGMGLGVGAQGAADLIGMGVRAGGQRISEGARRWAEGRAVKAASGQNKAAFKQMVGRQLSGSELGTIERVGGDLLDQNVVTAGATADDILARSAASADEAMAAADDALAELDAITPVGSGLNAAQIADDAERALVGARATGPYGQQQAGTRLIPEIEALRAQGDNVPISVLERFRRDLDNSIDWAAQEPTPAQAAIRDFRSFLDEQIALHAEKVAARAGSDAAARLREAKDLASSMIIAKGVARNRVVSDASNRWISPSDYGVGLAALGGSTAAGVDPISSTLASGGAALAHHLARTRGNQVLAAGLDTASGAIERAAPALASAVEFVAPATGRAYAADKSGPEISDGDLISQLATDNPAALGPYADTLSRSAASGNLPITHYVLSQRDPEYRMLVERLRRGGTP